MKLERMFPSERGIQSIRWAWLLILLLIGGSEGLGIVPFLKVLLAPKSSVPVIGLVSLIADVAATVALIGYVFRRHLSGGGIDILLMIVPAILCGQVAFVLMTQVPRLHILTPWYGSPMQWGLVIMLLEVPVVLIGAYGVALYARECRPKSFGDWRR